MDDNSSKRRVNARSHVRPLNYKRKVKKSRLLVETDKIQTADRDDNDITCIYDRDNEVNQDEVNQYEVNHDEVNQNEMNQDEMNQVSGLSEKNTMMCTAYTKVNGALDGMKNDDNDQPSNSLNTSGSDSSPENDSEDAETDFINFIKQQEDVSVEKLLTELDEKIMWKKYETEDETYEDDDQTFPSHVDGNTPVQPGHSLTTKMSVLLIWIFVMTNSLTSSQVSDLLTLINLHLLVANPVLNSLYRFKSFFGKTETGATKHYYCKHCTSAVSIEQQRCGNVSCNLELKGKNEPSYFVEMNVISQLKTLYLRRDFIDGLRYRFERSKKKEANIEDVYDGIQYKKLFENTDPFCNANNITFTLNTDGVPIFKSSKTSIWPIFLMVNELPYKMRKSRDFMILAGLWCGQSKPLMNFFLQPLFKTFDQLERGVMITTMEKENIEIRGYMFGMSCDIPARSAVLNMNQHNGESCCIKCLQTGVNHRTVSNGNVRIFPFDTDNPLGPERTHEIVLNSAREALNSGSAHINGIKGPSGLMFCQQFDTVKNVTIDYMHLVCLGVVRLMLKLWFDVSHSLNIFSLYRYVDVVDSKIETIKTPHYINRQPRTISEHLKFWKAAELRSWLLYYSIPCVMELMRPNYLYHYCALVEAIYLLNKSSISTADIEKSEQLLKYFVFMFPSLYDERYLTINVHSLLHLPSTVLHIGPLWTSSCFAFEGANGDLIKLFHGTQYIDLQIINAVHVFQMLPSLVSEIPENSVAYKYAKSMFDRSTYSSQFSFLGKSYKKDLNDDEILMFLNFLRGNFYECNFYARAAVRGVIYHSKDYTRVTKRNSYTVKYIHNNEICYGFVVWFAEPEKYGTDGKVSKLACIQKLERYDTDLFTRNCSIRHEDNPISQNFMNILLPHIHSLKVTNQTCLIELKDIIDLCLCIEMCEFCFVCEEPNHHEKNL